MRVGGTLSPPADASPMALPFSLLPIKAPSSLFLPNKTCRLYLQTCLSPHFPGQIQRVLTFPQLDQELREDKHHVWVLHYILPLGCGPKSDTEAAQGPFLMRLQRIPVVSNRLSHKGPPEGACGQLNYCGRFVWFSRGAVLLATWTNYPLNLGRDEDRDP